MVSSWKKIIPQSERVHVIREAHTSLISRNFGVGKTVAQLQNFFYWPRMNDIVSKYIKGCVMCETNKPSNRKRHDYLYVFVDRLRKMCILMPCKNQVIDELTAQLFFQHVWIYFWLPTFIISNRDSHFLGKFWSS